MCLRARIMRLSVALSRGQFNICRSLCTFFPGRWYPVLDDYQHNEQQDFVDYEEPSTDAAREPDKGLHRTDPREVIQLVAADRANGNT